MLQILLQCSMLQILRGGQYTMECQTSSPEVTHPYILAKMRLSEGMILGAEHLRLSNTENRNVQILSTISKSVKSYIYHLGGNLFKARKKQSPLLLI